jgi:peptidoglycan/xylan/chitin deacetylase (PgdA/CDA1 family)
LRQDSHKYHCFGVNCSIPRDIFLNFDGFDPHLTIEEDMEFGARLFDGGVNLVRESRAIVHHHDTKSLHSYLTQCWNASGHVHLYRALSKQQRNAQTEGLAAVRRRRSLRKAKAWVSSTYPDRMYDLANLFRQAAETTNWRFLFQIWMKLSISASYWGGIRSEGFTWGSLRNAVGAPLPVFSLHSICAPRERKERRYYLSPRRFQSFLKMFRALDYRSVTPEQGLFGQVSDKRFVLTFDDGYDDFYTEVFPHVSTFDLRPIVFLVVDQIGKSNAWDARLNYKSPRKLLSVQQVREMQRHGILFGSHTLTHPWLPSLSHSELCREVQESKSRLEGLLGSEVTYFAYPYGGLDVRVRAAIGQAGYKFGFSVEHGSNLWQDPLALRRMELSERDTYFSILLKLATDRSLENDILLPLAARLRRASKHLPPDFVRETRRIMQNLFQSL